MEKRYLKMFLMLSLIICGLLSVFSFSFATGQGETTWETLSQEASEYLEMAVNKMEEAIKTYQGVNYPNKELWVEAIDYAEKAIEADPDFIEAHYYLARFINILIGIIERQESGGNILNLFKKEK